MKNIVLRTCLPVMFVLAAYASRAQTITINGTGAVGGSAANNSVIVFAINNSNTYPVEIKQISIYRRSTSNTSSYTLWYLTNGVMTGVPADITTTNGWTEGPTTAGLPSTGTNSIQEIFSNVGVTIPANTMYRFAIHATTASGIPFMYKPNQSGSANNAVVNNVAVYTGNNATSPGYYGATFPAAATQVWFSGSVTFEPVLATCTDPVISAVSVDDTIVCSGSSTTLRVTGDLNDATAWHWYTGSCGGTPAGTGATLNVTPGVATTYYVRGEGGCVTPDACDEVSTGIAVAPTIAVVPEDITCHGADDGSIALTTSGGTGTLSYAWTGPGAYTSTSKDISGLAPGTYEVTVTTTPGGCTAVKDTVINEPLAVTASASSNSPLCAGATLNLSGGGSGGTGTLSYSWTGPGSYNVSVQNPSIPVAPTTATGVYTLTVEDANHCSGTDTAIVAVTGSTAAATPAVEATDTVVCSGGSTVLSINSGSLNDAIDWHWYTGSCGGTPIGTGATLNVTPGATTTYYVRGEGGCAPAGSCGNMTIIVASAPTLTVVPEDITCHGADDGSIALTTSGGTGTLSYAWTGPGAYTSASKDISGLVPGTYEVTVTTTPGGCTAVKDTVINEPLAVTASASSNSPLCAGATLNLSGSGSGGTGTLSYSWTGPGSYNVSVQNPSIPVAPTTATGVYTLTVEDANHCIGTDTAIVTINSSTPAAVPVLSVTATTICLDDSTTLSISSGSLNAAVNWHWYTGSCGGTPVGTGTSIRVSPAVTTEYYVRGEGGCATTAVCANAAVAVVTPVIPSVQIAANPGLTICSGTPVTFTATPVNGGTSPVYKWKKNGLSAGSNNISYTDNGLSSGDVITCVLASSELCAVPDSAGSNSLTMHVDPVLSPAVTVSAAPGDDICSGIPVTFTATPVHGGTAPVYQWKKNGSNEGGNMPVYTDNALNDSDVISCELTSNALCPDNPTVTSNHITMQVTIVPEATVTASGSTIICEQDEVLLSADESGFAYQWYRNGTPIPGATSQDHPVSEDGSYTVEVVNGNCSAMTAVPVKISTLPLPGPIVIVTKDTLVTLLTYDAYQWLLDGSLIPGATSRQHIAQESGIYTVVVTDSNGCAGISAWYTVTVGDLAAGHISDAGVPVKVYPNPSAGTLYIDAPYPVQVALYGMDGRLVARQDDARVMNIGHLKPGLYMVQVSDPHSRITIKTEKLLKLE